MCSFFSLVSNGKGKPYYFDWELRKKILSKELDYDADSHTSIADYHGFKGEKEDSLNKYEYNPLTRKFVKDQINTSDDSEEIEKFCNKLDFKTIISPFLIKDIIHPLNLPEPKVTDIDIKLLKQWDSVWASVWDSVWASVGASVWDSVRDSVGDSVRDSVWDSVWASVWDSVGASVRDSVRDSVGASVWVYISSFFLLDEWKYIDHKKGENPFQPCIGLWEMGLIPSFDGKMWRLHGGKDAKILYEIKKEDL